MKNQLARALSLVLILAASGPASAATPDAQEIAIGFDARIGDQPLRWLHESVQTFAMKRMPSCEGPTQ